MGINSIKKFEEEVLFTQTDIGYIKSFFHKWTEGFVHDGEESFKDYRYRKCFSTIPIKDKELIKFVVNKLKPFGVKSINHGIQLMKYGEGNYFRTHRDYSPTKYSWRYKSLVTQLSESSEYEGGTLLIKGRPMKKDLGNTVMFDSNIPHEVMELTKGTRITMVLWLSKEDII